MMMMMMVVVMVVVLMDNHILFVLTSTLSPHIRFLVSHFHMERKKEGKK